MIRAKTITMLPKFIEKNTPKSHTSLANFTTWKVGGPAEWIAEPRNIYELTNLICWAEMKGIPCHVIGAGSNILINDYGLKGLTLCTRKFHGYTIDKKTGIIEACSGESIPNLVRKAAKQGLHGLEWAVGIPGTIGGATVMNAGAQGGVTENRIISVKVFSIEKKKIYELHKNDLEYSYRKSLLQEEKLIVLSSRFQLEPGFNPEKLSNETNQNLQNRLNSQPYNLPSCGSVFRNPKNDKAGRMIEDLGLKGLREGQAEVSCMHANFIINNGSAKASEITRLISIIQSKVKEKHGLLLHPEVIRLGFE